jgi:hypothetical protein
LVPENGENLLASHSLALRKKSPLVQQLAAFLNNGRSFATSGQKKFAVLARIAKP